jgi:hypothetical protein
MTSRILPGILLLGLLAVHASAQEPPWDPSVVKPCDRSCLTAIMDRFLAAMINHDPSGLPLERDVRMTENTAAMDVGEGILWRAKVEPTTFKLYVADPVAGQVGLQTVLIIEGRPALVAIRLKVERVRILEIEELLDRSMAPQAMELLRTPRSALVNDVAASERTSREGLLRAAHSYFDALEGTAARLARSRTIACGTSSGTRRSTTKRLDGRRPDPTSPRRTR